MFEDCWKRMTILGAVLTALATPACAVDTDESEDVAELEMSLSNVVVPPQTIVPVTTNYTERDPNETYVPPSFSTPLPRDTRLDLPNNNSDFALFANPGSLTIQKMEGRDFWMMMNLYSVTVHKGDAGLLLIDTAGHGGPPEFGALIGGLRQIGDWQPGGAQLPLKVVMYSHPHSDHVGHTSALFLIATLKKLGFQSPADIDPSNPVIAGLLAQLGLSAPPPIPPEAWEIVDPNLKIVSTIWALDEIKDEGLNIPKPNKVLFSRNAKFKFEGRKFRVVTPVQRSAHTAADSYIITPDGLLTCVDIVQAGRLPFIRTSVSQDYGGYLKMLRHLKWEADNENFYAANWGHFNVGLPKDVQFILDYFETANEIWWERILVNQPGKFVSPQFDNASLWLENLFDEVAREMFVEIEPFYRDKRHIETGRGHMASVHEYMFLNYLNSADPRLFETLGMCGLIDQQGNPLPPPANYPDNCAPGAFDNLPVPEVTALPRPWF